jgi:putative mRNA 3-end processing factor
MSRLLEFTPRGIYCPRADCYIDPKRAVDRAVITHAHSDHARRGSKHYLAHSLTVPVLYHRLGKKISAEAIDYGEVIIMNGVRFSLHPAGHVIGSAQVRVEYRGEIWVVTGDYKLDHDPLAGSFEPIRCTVFCSESTFGLPVYRWPDSREVIEQINRWWRDNAAADRPSVLFGYSLGKAQRLLYGIDRGIGPVFVHPSIRSINDIFRDKGLPVPEARLYSYATPMDELRNALIIIPPSAYRNGEADNLVASATAHVSGWMATARQRMSRQADAGFVISDHADWDGLNEAVRMSGAEHIYVTHGFSDQFSRWLRERGLNAYAVNE